MAKRDPLKTARNKRIEEYSAELKGLLPFVERELGRSEGSIHGLIGGKNLKFIDLHRTIITKPDEFVSLWLEGYEQARITGDANNLEYALKKSKTLKRYLYVFLKRTFLREYDHLSRPRPTPERSYIWMGQNHADYGLFVSPRFKPLDGWENDRSEIRRFEKEYWTIGHILKTGLVTPDSDRITEFPDIKSYLTFFQNTIVRNSKSPYEREIAKRYVQYVESSSDPEKIPLLIPEFRYGGIEKKHIYRLDFTILCEYAKHKRVGFELSPWSTHGHISGTKKKSQDEINTEAQKNFEDEMEKHKAFFKNHDIFVMIYTDKDLKDIDAVFEDMKIFLNPKPQEIQLNLGLFLKVLGVKPNSDD